MVLHAYHFRLYPPYSQDSATLQWALDLSTIQGDLMSAFPRVLLFGLMMLLVSACAPVYSGETAQSAVPTLAPSPLPPPYNLDAAEDAARRYLNAWQDADYATMHSLITFSGRDSTPLSDFVALYEDVAADMTLLDVSYEGVTLVRDQPSVARFRYNVTFETLIVGTFTDPNRDLQLVLDPTDNAWRVAWSAGDIFTEMGGGAALRLERVIPRRANIYDRNGAVLADMNGRMVTMNVVQANIPDLNGCVRDMAAALDVERTTVEATLARYEATWLAQVGVLEPDAYLAYQARITQDCAAEFDSFATRQYPNGTLMPHLLGDVGFPDPEQVEALQAAGFPPDSIVGRSGIERSWDETLRGRPGGRLLIVDGQQVLRVIAENPPQPAESVWLTIDSGLQRFIQDRITQTYRNAAEAWAPASRGAAAMVIDVHTGAVLAMVSYPTYDGNAFVPYPVIGREAANAVINDINSNPRTPQLNRATQGLYPSGSTMKIATTLAVVDSGIYTADQRFSCIGSWARERGFVRSDWLPQGHGLVTTRTALAQSCNPFFYEAGYQLDLRDPFLMPSLMRSFGLGVPTGLTDLAENPGNIPDPDYVRTRLGLEWSFSRSVNMAIGQDLDVTPLQIARLGMLVANGGTLYRPQLVYQTGLIGESFSHTLQPEVMAEVVISEEALEVTRRGMCDVTQERYGTAEYQFRNQRIQAIQVCGKTGTATAPGDGVLPHAWFVAYAPMDAPEIAVLVMVENAGEGSAVSAPIARDILDYYFFEMAD